jgi:predicted DNA-binding protein with PD1-like motif
MAELAGAVDELKLVGDFAHWTAETKTEPWARTVLDGAITTVAPHVHHLHARVGHDNGLPGGCHRREGCTL